MKAQDKTIKVLMAKTSLDGHWRGVLAVTMALRNSGMEVVYGGEITADEIVRVAVHEDVDVVGLNVGGSYAVVEEIVNKLRQTNLDNVLIIAGGTIPPEDIPLLKQLGVAEVFPPGSLLEDIVSFVRQHASPRSA